MDMVLGAIEEQALSQIPEELVQEYNSEIEHCLLKKKKPSITFLPPEMIYLQSKSNMKVTTKTKTKTKTKMIKN